MIRFLYAQHAPARLLNQVKAVNTHLASIDDRKNMVALFLILHLLIHLSLSEELREPFRAVLSARQLNALSDGVALLLVF